MGYYKLFRQALDGKAVRGTLYYCEPGIHCQPLLVRAASTLENANCLIPALVYPVSVTLSPRFNTLLPLIRNVPGRSGIRIHGGIRPEHSQGCVLLNRKNEYKAVVERLLYEQEHGEDIRLEIIDFKPGDKPIKQTIVPLNYTSYEKIPTFQRRLGQGG